MTNTGKALIVGVLLLDLGVGAYLLFPKDERSPVVTGTVVGSIATTATTAVIDSSSSETHVTAGSVVRTTPPAKGADYIAMTPPPNATQPPPNANVTTVAPDSNRVAGDVANGPRPETHTLAPGEVQRPPGEKSKPVLRAEQGLNHEHDDTHRRSSNQVSTAMTELLVRESAKLDPLLPPPPPSSSPPPQPSRSGLNHGASNPVAAALTDQLVRESAKVNPAPQSASQSDNH